ncbi:MAG: patatin-like phospholipase family protein [Actinomycetota bacterium]
MSSDGPREAPSGDGPAIGLVLGGGGIAGYAFHCGVLAALDEIGFDPRTASVVVGTSAGSIVAALLRGGVTAPTIRDRLLADLQDPDEMARIRLLAGRSSRAVPRIWAGPGSPGLALAELRKGPGLRLTRLATGLLPRGRLELDPVSDPLNVLHGDRWPDRPLWIPATDLASGRRTVFGQDHRPPVALAVAASCALPGFFEPAEVDGRTYVDGGVDSPFNLDLLAEHRTTEGRPLDLVVVAAPLSVKRIQPTSPLDAVARALPRRRLRSEMRRITGSGIPVLALEPNRASARAMGLNPMDYHGLDDIIERSAEMVDRRIDRLGPIVRAILESADRLERPTTVPYPETAPLT